MGVMDKNLDIITYAVSFLVNSVIMTSIFSGMARKRSLKRLAATEADAKKRKPSF